jgi:hypothetical protein
MPDQIECPGCGVVFTPTHGLQRFCKVQECVNARVAARYKKWYDKQPREKLNEQQRAYRGRTDVGRRLELKAKYGITLEQWATMVSLAGNRCEICGVLDDRLCVDHDHVTGLVRGALCRQCNRAIGQLGDSLEGIRKAERYLAETELGRNVPGNLEGVGIQEYLF